MKQTQTGAHGHGLVGGKAHGEEPPLKPNQQNQRMNTPSAPAVRLWPGMAWGLPSLSYLPMRGPSICGTQQGDHAAHHCGRQVEPAKSWKPMLTAASRRPRSSGRRWGRPPAKWQRSRRSKRLKLVRSAMAAGDDGGGGGAEHGLEHDVGPQRDIKPGRMAVIALNERDRTRRSDALVPGRT